MIKKLILLLFGLIMHSCIIAQTMDDFYRGMANLHILYQPQMGAIGLQAIDFYAANPNKGGYSEVRVRFIGDIINTKFPKNFSDDRAILGLLEMNFGKHFIAKQKFNIAFGGNPLQIWTINAGDSETHFLGGVFAKVDVRVTKSLMFRALASPDFISYSRPYRANVLLLKGELIHSSGLFWGFDYINAKHYDFLEDGENRVKTLMGSSFRIEVKTGYKLGWNMD